MASFNVYGPKIVAMRRSFEDQALESRFFTEVMGSRPLRKDIPINLPERQKEEALTLRNRLLSYRLATLPKLCIDDSLVNPKLSPRLNQILVPLLSIVEDEELRMPIRMLVQGLDDGLRSARASSIEGLIVEVLSDLYSSGKGRSIPVGEVTATLQKMTGEDTARPITARYVGYLLRTRLGIETVRRQGVYVVPEVEPERLAALSARYGLALPSNRNIDVTENHRY